jgi:hypothetical protein
MSEEIDIENSQLEVELSRQAEGRRPLLPVPV